MSAIKYHVITHLKALLFDYIKLEVQEPSSYFDLCYTVVKIDCILHTDRFELHSSPRVPKGILELEGETKTYV